MPNRIIKESIRTSRTVNSMTDFQFRLWVYLITYVDDFGRGQADPELIKGLVFPRRKRVSESDIEKTLAELAGMGCISLYQVDGESYFCFPNWGKHQRIQSKRPKFPGPEEGSATVVHGDSPWVTVDSRDLPPESNPIQSESESNPTKAMSAVGDAGRAKFGPENPAYQAAVYLDREICARLPEKKRADERRLQAWAAEFDRCHRLDGYDWENIGKVLRFSQKDSFWSANILSGKKFREKYVQLLAKMQQKSGADGKKATIPEYDDEEEYL